VYVAVNDDEGRVVRKSNPLAILIRGASAATVAQAATAEAEEEALLDAQSVALQDTVTETNFTLFLLGGAALVLVALMLVAAIMRQKNDGGLGA
jgi:hypothetical protein